MALKTFNINSEIYKKFSEHCKEHGISMSKKIENFIKQEMENISMKELFPQEGKKSLMQAKSLRGFSDEMGKPEHSFKKYC